MKRKVSDITKGLIQLEEKRKIINGLRSELMKCMADILMVSIKGNSVYKKVNRNRVFKVMAFAMKAKMIKAQIDMVKAQPIFPKGGLSIVGEEYLKSKEIK